MGSYAATVLADKPVRYYRLSETSGTTAYDQTTNLSNGTIFGGSTLNQAGLVFADTDGSLLLDGTSGYVSIPTSGLPTGANPISVECWGMLPSLPAKQDNVLINIGTNSDLHNLQLDYQHSTLAFSFYSWTVGQLMGTTLRANQVFHAAITFDGTTLIFYQNGAVEGSETLALNLTYGNVFIGSDGIANDYWPGYIDEVAIYNTALSATQVQNHYRAGMSIINFPIIIAPFSTRDGLVTAVGRDGHSLTTRTRG